MFQCLHPEATCQNASLVIAILIKKWMDGQKDGQTGLPGNIITETYIIEYMESYRIWMKYTVMKTCLLFSMHLE